MLSSSAKIVSQVKISFTCNDEGVMDYLLVVKSACKYILVKIRL